MRRAGRISAAEAATVVQPDFGGKRPDPPPELTKREQDIWRTTTAAEPAGFFTDGAVLAMLADYCAHRECAEKLTGMIHDFDDEWMKSREGLSRYHSLLKMRELETRGAAHLATKLRLTNQSRFRSDVKTNKMPGQPGPMPWE
jgi:hypothetical protein